MERLFIMISIIALCGCAKDVNKNEDFCEYITYQAYQDYEYDEIVKIYIDYEGKCIEEKTAK